MAPAFSSQVADQDEPRSPQDSPGRIESQERGEMDLRHPGKAGHQDSKGGGEPPKEDGRTAAPPHERLGPVQGSLQMMADHGEPPQGSPKEAPPPQAADEIADGVPDDGSANRRPDGRRQGDPMLEGQHSAQDDRDLSGKDESNE